MIKKCLPFILLSILFLNCKPLLASACTDSIPAGVSGPVVDLLFDSNGMIKTQFTISGVAPVDTCLGTVPISLTLNGDIGGVGFEQTNILGEDDSILGLSPTSSGDCNPEGGTSTYLVPVDTYNLWAADGVIDLYIDTDADIDNICIKQTIQGSIVFPIIGLQAEGFVNSTSGGVGFPDGTLQTTAFQGANPVGSGDVDSSEVQLRVTGSCAVGSSIAVINEDGNVICETNKKSYFFDNNPVMIFSVTTVANCIVGPHTAGANEVASMNATIGFKDSLASTARITNIYSTNDGASWDFCNLVFQNATNPAGGWANVPANCRLPLTQGVTYRFAVGTNAPTAFTPGASTCSNLVEIAAEP